MGDEFDYDDDDDDAVAKSRAPNPFSPPVSSGNAGTTGLSNLFSGGGDTSGSSLRYQAPKQPKPAPSAAPARQPQASILMAMKAREVYLYVASEERQVPQGPCGLAFLGDKDIGAYTLLLYKTQTQHLARVPFTAAFKLDGTINGLYCTLYDPAGHTWTILFQSEEEVRQYALATVLGKYGAMAGPGQIGPELVMLDTVVGSGSELSVDDGDQVGLWYTGWLRTADDPLRAAQKFDGNVASDKPFAVKVGKGKVIQGWETGLKGMRKGGKRLLVIPPHFAYGETAKPAIPARSTLIFEVELVKAKFDKTKPRAGRGTPTVPTAETQTATAVAPATAIREPADAPVPEAPAPAAVVPSATAQDPTKQDLLNRMQRIGMSVPFPGSAGNEIKISEAEQRLEEEKAAKQKAEDERKAQELQLAEERRREELAAEKEKAELQRKAAEEQAATVTAQTQKLVEEQRAAQ
eukprot:SAG31_NODE_5619_length_2421_cov_3.190353_1_plen_463_part_10